MAATIVRAMRYVLALSCLLSGALSGCAQDVVYIEPLDVGPRDGATSDGGANERPRWSAFDVRLTDRFNAVHGTAADDVWAVGERGLVFHFDGRAWTRVDVGVLEELNDVFAVSRTDVWVVGDNGSIAHFFDGLWTRVTGVVPMEIGGGGLPDLVSVAAASGDGEVWILPDGPVDVGGVTSEHAALRYTLGTWSVIERPDPGSAEVAVVLRDGQGFILHDNDLQAQRGASWANVEPPVRASLLTFRDASLDAQGRLWVVASQITPSRARVFRSSGSAWSELDGDGLSDPLFGTDLAAIWADGDQAWAVGELGQLSHFDGQTWAVRIPPDFAMPKLLGMYVTGTQVLAVGQRGGLFCYGCP